MFCLQSREAGPLQQAKEVKMKRWNWGFCFKKHCWFCFKYTKQYCILHLYTSCIRTWPCISGSHVLSVVTAGLMVACSHFDLVPLVMRRHNFHAGNQRWGLHHRWTLTFAIVVYIKFLCSSLIKQGFEVQKNVLKQNPFILISSACWTNNCHKRPVVQKWTA